MNRTITAIETAYIVAALRFMLDANSDLEDRDRDIMTALMLRLAGTLPLTTDIKRKIDQ